jgi:transcriptional regulator with XRE-family HTH domain
MVRPKGVERASRKYKQSPEFLRARARLGERIRALRRGRGLTLEAAAERMELDFKHLQKIEAGQGNVTLVTLVRLAAGLEVSLEALFTNDATESARERSYAPAPRELARVADSYDPDAAPSGPPSDEDREP